MIATLSRLRKRETGATRYGRLRQLIPTIVFALACGFLPSLPGSAAVSMQTGDSSTSIDGADDGSAVFGGSRPGDSARAGGQPAGTGQGDDSVMRTPPRSNASSGGTYADPPGVVVTPEIYVGPGWHGGSYYPPSPRPGPRPYPPPPGFTPGPGPHPGPKPYPPPPGPKPYPPPPGFSPGSGQGGKPSNQGYGRPDFSRQRPQELHPGPDFSRFWR